MTSVAIVGGGPSGLYALQALAEASEIGEIALFEAGARWGLGTPYDPALNHPSLLANIASYELPPLGETLADWLAGLGAAAREKLGVGKVDARAFYPRVALGAYFEAQHTRLQAALGPRARVHLNTRVEDVLCGPEGVTVLFTREGGALESAAFDYVIVATGHRSRPPRALQSLASPAYPPPVAPLDKAFNVAILGASLTAIDAALALALARGDFHETADGLAYAPQEGTGRLNVTMLSRRGLLPEADFYFPYPYAPLNICHAAALAEAVAQGGLDAAFALFAREVAADDPAFAAEIGLDRLDADTFADAYFGLRRGDPFEAACRNLSEARESERCARVSAYRYAILRAHEAFAEVAPQFSPRDRARFQRGLQRVFVDNYAAVPPLSIERLLALHAAGVLEIETIAERYRLEKAPEGVAIVGEGGAMVFDVVIDARGEGVATPQDLPFPTLRLQILANARFSGGAGSDLPVTDALGLAPGVNPVERVYCLAAPFLLSRRPFVQGLTSAHDLAARAVADLRRHAARPPQALAPPSGSGALYLGGGLVVTTAP